MDYFVFQPMGNVTSLVPGHTDVTVPVNHGRNKFHKDKEQQ